MVHSRILVSWIGHADLSAMIDDLEESSQDLRRIAKIGSKYGEKPGPIKTAIQLGSFDQVHLLSNYDPRLHDSFAVWLGCKPQIHPVELSDPTDYERIFLCTNQVLTEIAKKIGSSKSKLCILLSPGTPAMAVVWVLLGKSRYQATFYQTVKGKLNEAKIPQALFEEVVPDLIRDRDINFQHLASKNPAEVEGFEQVVGESTPIRLAVGRAQRAALRDVPVLILGESGTGKELFAQAIHKASRRKIGPFEAINCAAIPRDLLEAELFGYEKGAFTGADRARDGAFSRADGGTLFLDEIGECDPLLQTKLLRVLQPPAGKSPSYREFRPIGSSKMLSSDVRLLAATNRDLREEITANRFREDLYYRIAVISLKLPPLRERRMDIPILATALLDKINKEFEGQEPGYKYKEFSDSTKDFVIQYDWPGNIRQLYNSIVQAAVMTDTDRIDREDMMEAIGDMVLGKPVLSEPSLGNGFDLEEHLNSLRKQYLRKAMREAHGNKSKAARLLGIKHYQTLDAQLERLQVDWKDSGN